MGSTPAQPAKTTTSQPVVQRGSGKPLERPATAAQPTASQPARKPAGYGLPCAKCRTYYPADLTVCPVCKHSERVAVSASQGRMPVVPTEQLPDRAVLEQERERFLGECTTKLSTQMAGQASAFWRCIRDENHQDRFASAAVCQECYEHLQQRVDVLEAALHMDLKEAAQIVYDAVWADPSDSSRTYENAAHALLSELRKRSGVTTTFTLLSQQTMAD